MTDDLIPFLNARLVEAEHDIRESRMLSEGHWALPTWLDRDHMLAEVDAKRRILDAYTAAHRDYRSAVSGGVPSEARARVCDALMTVLRLLSLPYVGHPDYREEWRPGEPT
jgi:hypothetical protein